MHRLSTYARSGRAKKVFAFVHPFYKEKYGYVPLGTFGSAISKDGSKLYVTWNGNRGGAGRRGRLPFDTCAMTVIHIPASERRPSIVLPSPLVDYCLLLPFR